MTSKPISGVAKRPLKKSQFEKLLALQSKPPKISVPARQNRTTAPSITSTPSSSTSRQTPLSGRLAKLLAKQSKTQPTTPRTSLAGMTSEEIKAHQSRLRAAARSKLSDTQRKIIKDRDAQARKERRDSMSEDERVAARAREAQRKKSTRANTNDRERAANACRMRDEREKESQAQTEKRRLKQRHKETPTVRPYTAACRRRHTHTNGTYLPCAAHSAGHYPKYKNHGIIGAKTCKHCNADLFRDEESNECCGNGTVKCKPFANWDEAVTNEHGQRIPKHPGLQYIKHLLDPDFATPEHKNFQTNIVQYNTVHSMGSLSTHTLPHLPGGMPSVRMNGEITAQIGNLMPGNIPGTDQTHTPLHLQLYFCHNISTATALRLQNPLGSKLLASICTQIAQTLEDCNPIFKRLQTLKQQHDLAEAGVDAGVPPPQYWVFSILDHRPNDEEMFALFDSRDNNPPDPNLTGIWIKAKGNAMKRIDMNNGNIYMLMFPMMLPFGEQGWHMGIPLNYDSPDNDDVVDQSITDLPCDDESLLERLAATNQTRPYFEEINHRNSSPANVPADTPNIEPVSTEDFDDNPPVQMPETMHPTEPDPANLDDDIAHPNADISEHIDYDDSDDNSSVFTLPQLANPDNAIASANSSVSEEPMDVDPSSSHSSSDHGIVAGEPMDIDDGPQYGDIHVYPDDVEEYAINPVINQFTNEFLLAMTRVAVRNQYNPRRTVVINPSYFMGYYDHNGNTHTVDSLAETKQPTESMLSKSRTQISRHQYM